MILTAKQIEYMRYACSVTRDLHAELAKRCKVGTKLSELNDFAEKFIREHNCKPNFKGVGGFPFSICASLNNEVVHGRPDSRIVQKGDLVKIDLGCSYNGIHSDAARTLVMEGASDTAIKLAEVAKQCFFEGLKGIKAGSSVNQIGYQVQKYVERHGFSVVRDMCGHGIGTKLHMEPDVLNFDYPPLRHIILNENEAIAVEPMVNEFDCEVDYDKRTLLCTTADGGLSAHYENTVLITNEGVEILTL